MSEIATNNRQITLYCIEDSVKAKQTLAYAQVESVALLIIDISKTPLTGTQLAELAKRLGVEIEDLIDRDHELLNASIEPLDLSSDDWIKMIRKNPEILKQPIAIWGDQTLLVETPTDLLKL
ncbi:MAG: hypothetical protein A3D92_22650 [Bacteroidetes bacterium RIFCSPHIGHO2_02_FULL_44_7]|nr:MAG: hypothetical protein A3D92_22650 [Bacteroidetes bacterium RIFCSPHIGHO2_02_FULL_44_7]